MFLYSKFARVISLLLRTFYDTELKSVSLYLYLILLSTSELHTLAPMVPWLDYINNILTEDLLQVEDTERVIVDEPGYLRNLTQLLPETR